MQIHAWLLAIAVTAASASQALRAVAQPAVLDDARCRLVASSLPAAFGSCGTLTVPEDPARPDGSAIELFVARMPSSSATPRADPLLVITGGPGQSTVDFYLQLRPAFDPVRREREIILVDQRGTGRSADGFACTVPDDLSLDTAGSEALMQALDDCVAMLEHDARFYTTSVAVQDLERVRVALGIETWNIYGVSYGTRVAQHYLRRFPERVRAAILDGVVPPDLALGPDVAREAQRALEQTFARCAADAGCAERFAELPQQFAALLARLDATGAEGAEASAELPVAALSAPELRALVRFMSYDSVTVALLPVLLAEAYSGNYSPLASQARTLLRDLPEALSFPMSNSVTCTEDVPFIRAESTEGLADTYLGTTIVDALRLICGRWPAGTIDPDFKTAVVSDKPVLLLSGENDPITPPAYAERVIAGGLTNSAHIVPRGQGHGMLRVGCTPRLVRQFLETPEPAELDASCIDAEVPTPFFLSLLGPAP